MALDGVGEDPSHSSGQHGLDHSPPVQEAEPPSPQEELPEAENPAADDDDFEPPLPIGSQRSSTESEKTDFTSSSNESSVSSQDDGPNIDARTAEHLRAMGYDNFYDLYDADGIIYEDFEDRLAAACEKKIDVPFSQRRNFWKRFVRSTEISLRLPCYIKIGVSRVLSPKPEEEEQEGIDKTPGPTNFVNRRRDREEDGDDEGPPAQRAPPVCF